MVRICVICGNELIHEDEYTNVCYRCQDKLLENFPLIGEILNSLLFEVINDLTMEEKERKRRTLALYNVVRIFGEEPDINIENADDFLDNEAEIVNILNDILRENEEADIEGKLGAWRSYALINAIKEVGGEPYIEFIDSKYHKYFKFD